MWDRIARCVVVGGLRFKQFLRIMGGVLRSALACLSEAWLACALAKSSTLEPAAACCVIPRVSSCVS